jgi:molybdate transport system substrate-binding protein
MDKSVKKISIANPKLAPYGVAAMEIIEKTTTSNEIKEKIVLADNVAQATHFVDTGAAEIGLIPYALLKNNTEISGKFILLDDKLYTPLEHCFIITKQGEEKKLTQEFSDFVLSQKGKAIIEKHGFKAN